MCGLSGSWEETFWCRALSSEAMKDNELSAFVLCTFLSGGGNNC